MGWVPGDTLMHFWNLKYIFIHVGDAFLEKKTVISVQNPYKILILTQILLFWLLSNAPEAWKAPQVEPGSSS